ncbi:hypothetical protein ABZS66_00070 [Dactylosporangium sp. NPDC005572]|uniref:hypothetical protein n=1 Tax=Dactylosporangium sp. NPDC005572 TaxID=3156889 RepID=UPI0033A93DD3
MRTIAPPAAAPAPDTGYQALLDQLTAAVDQLRSQVALARHTDPGQRRTVLAALAGHLHAAGAQLHQQLLRVDDGWPPLPAEDEAP